MLLALHPHHPPPLSGVARPLLHRPLNPFCLRSTQLADKGGSPHPPSAGRGK